MAFFELNKDLLMGIQQVDKEHQGLVDLINELYEAMSRGQGKEKIGKTITGLINYIEIHFKNEEKLLHDYGYSEYRAHLLQHYLLTKEVKEIQEKWNSGQPLVIPQVSEFLKDWLTKHIMISDKHYEPFLKAKGVK